MPNLPAVSLQQFKEEGDNLSVGLLQRVMPPNRQGMVTQELVDDLNEILKDERLRENFRENLLSFMRILKDPKFRIRDYINAVKYVSFKMLGDSNIEAYTKVFPEKYQNYLDRDLPSNEINNRVASFNRGQLVTLLIEQTLIPGYILNQDLYQKALNAQAGLMMNARSEKVRSDAANSLLIHLKMPETAKIELDVTVKEDDSIAELKKTTLDLVTQQKKMLEAGAMNAGEVAKQKIVAGVVIENGEDGREV